MEQIKRTKAIKIRLTDEEHERLKELQQGNELATWMRTTCLNIGEAQQAKAGVVSGNGKYSTLRIFTPTSFNDIQHGIFA